eukprot:TRINITY_DN7093_c0_g2_i3.p1 TRINITY_DN7093_c0_g2~~TRINITY_DN7093_c0_g2_i3.p1  ORF type:complete len:180 (-),score=21.04 TRINITY_DN7093_c0_g2_i3:194-733(-)
MIRKEWISKDVDFASEKSTITESLISEIKVAHSCQIRATMWRRGHYTNLNYKDILGASVRNAAITATQKSFDQLFATIERAQRLLQTASAKKKLQHFLKKIQKMKKDFEIAAEQIGIDYFEKWFGEEDKYWLRCKDAAGPGFAKRLLKMTKAHLGKRASSSNKLSKLWRKFLQDMDKLS